MSVIKWVKKKIADIGIVRLVRPWVANAFTAISMWLIALGTIAPENVTAFQVSGEAVVLGVIAYLVGMAIDTKD